MVMMLMTVRSEWPSKLLVMYGERFAVRLDCSACTKYMSHMLWFDISASNCQARSLEGRSNVPDIDDDE